MASETPEILPPAPPRPFLGLRPVVAGTACCAISALGYAVTHICMKRVNALGVDSMWAVTNKELVTVVVLGPWLLWQLVRGRRIAISRRAVLVLAIVGLGVQMVGNLGLQWAFGVVGLAVAIPAMFAAMLAASGLLGSVLLHEPVSLRSVASIGLLLLALVLLGMATQEAAPAPETPVATLTQSPAAADPGAFWFLLGLAACCVAGTIYAVLTITIRTAMTANTSMSAVVIITTLMGVITLGPLSFYRLGSEQLLAVSGEQAAWMLLAGTLNLISFLAITKGLHLTTVLHVNVLNASQVGIAAVAGLWFFGEPLTVWLALGVMLTIVGIVAFERPAESDRHADQHA